MPVHDDFVKKWLGEHPLRRTVEVRQTDRISAPISYGVFRPIILLPSKIDLKNDKELSYVLTHEYIHIRRLDLLTKFVLVLTCCIHWFNPMVWLMYLLFNRDLELSCDESVIKQFGENSKETYAGALIHMEEKRSLLMPFCNSFSKTAIEERIRAIMKTKKVTVGVIVVSVIAVLTVIIMFATSAKPERDKHLMADFDVPDVVVEQAKEYATELFQVRSEFEPEANYSDWRIENLQYEYTYDDFDGKVLDIYQMNYQLKSDTPNDVVIAGGREIFEDGWVRPDYPDSLRLVFEKEEGRCVFLFSLYENDCFPGDEIFAEDLRIELEKLENIEIETIESEEIASQEKFEGVPDVVLGQAKEYVLDRYNMASEGSPINEWDYTDYIDWRIESLKHVHTYEDFYDGKDYEIYQLNYQFLAKTPDEVTLVGGMTITEDGWVVPEYAYSSYFVYEKKYSGIQYVTFLFVNDGIPGDGNEPFTSDLELALDKVFYQKTALENSELKNTFSIDDIGVDYIYEGAFSKPGAKEIFVDCRFLNMPHVGGLDRRMFLLFDEESSELLAFKEIPTDRMDFTVLPCADGHNNIAVCANATSQGITTQTLSVYEIQGTEWVEKPIESLTEILGGMEEYYLWLETDQITVTPSREESAPGEELARFQWNPSTKQFECSYLREAESVDISD